MATPAAPAEIAVPLSASGRRSGLLACLALLALVAVFGVGFAWLSVHRHETFRTNAEDLGFTDQVIWNWLRGQAFRMSLYEQAAYQTDIDLAALKRPDSLLAFHVEPMTALLAPLYLIWADVRLMLIVQAVGWSLGAIPVYRLAWRRLDSGPAALALAAVYLLSPLGQWAVLSDLHTVLLAAPLLLWALDLLETGHARALLIVLLLAASAKEEVGLAVAGVGLLALWRRRSRRAGLGAVLLGAGWSLLCVTVIIPRYAGTALSPFTARYAELGGSPGQAALNIFEVPGLYLAALNRLEVLGYLGTLLLAGGWLALLAPEYLLPLAPSLALNVFSNSPWMASGRAHYSSVVLPFVAAAAVVGCGRLAGWLGRRDRAGAGRRRSQAVPVALALLALATTAFAYRQAGAGPLAEGFVVPPRTEHHALAARLLDQIPADAKVSASSSLVPHLSQRTDVYLFPTLRGADYLALDVTSTPYPISAGDVYLRAIDLLGNGEWRVLAAEDGLLLLRRAATISQPLPERFFDFARAQPRAGGTDEPLASYLDGALELVSAELWPSGDLGPNGALGALRTTWRASRPLEGAPRPRLVVQVSNGLEQEYSDFATLWWYPPERWRAGELIQLEVAGLPLRDVVGWRASVPPPGRSEEAALAAVAPGPDLAAADPDLFEQRLGELTVQVRRSSWRLAVLDPRGQLLWQEADLTAGDRNGPLGFQLQDGSWWHLTRLIDSSAIPDGVALSAATDDPAGRTARVELTSLGPRSFRLQMRLSEPEGVAAVAQAVPSPADEHLLGFGERFTAVDQRGRVVTTWAEDRRVAGYGDSTYAPLPFFISSRGYSLALETDVRSVFDLAAERPDRYSWQAETDAISLVFSHGPSPRQLVEQQVARTGRPPLPPIWAFGVWKTAIGGQPRVLEDAARIRALDLPVSALYVYDVVDPASNIGWPYSTFTGQRTGEYDDPRALTDQLHAQGFKALTYNTADFHVDRENYAFPAEQGFFLRAADGQPYVHPGFQLSWLDFSNPQVVAWWGQLWKRALVELGFDGGMLDLGELTPPDALYANGRDGRSMHNRYPVLYARAAFEAVAAHKPESVLFGRSGGAGAQAFQHLQWPGDPLIDWSEANGFKSMLPAALSSGLSGFPNWHPEVGGYLATGLPRESERELWHRWLQLGAFTSLLRDNYGDHQTGSAPVEVWSDDETINAFRTYGRLHNQLVPYLYSYARQASESGLPLLRHLVLNYPDDPRAWLVEDQYTLGDELLVAPVVEEGARSRTVYLPRGQWADFWSGAVFEGGRDITVAAPLDRIPVFVKAGAILPLAADFDTLAPSTDPAVRAWNGDLVVKIMPANGPARSSFRLYDGSELAYQTDGRRASLSMRGAPFERGLEVELPAAGAPGSVLVNGGPVVDWRYAAERAAVVVRLTAAEVTIAVEE